MAGGPAGTGRGLAGTRAGGVCPAVVSAADRGAVGLGSGSPGALPREHLPVRLPAASAGQGLPVVPLPPPGQDQTGLAGSGAPPAPARFIAHRIPIHQRPLAVATRETFGHWEADLMSFGRSGPVVLALHERASRLLLGGPPREQGSRRHRSYPGAPAGCPSPGVAPDPHLRQRHRVRPALPPPRPGHPDLLLRHPFPLAEGRAWRTPSAACGAPLPRSTKLGSLSEAAFTAALQLYNNTPRKCLGYRTPARRSSTNRCCTWNVNPPSRFRGNDDGGVGARGSCQGGGCTAPRPCPGFPLSRERRWGNAEFGKRPPWRSGEWGREGRPQDGPFESLRTGLGRRDLGSARHAMRFERPSGLWHHCQGSRGVFGARLCMRASGEGAPPQANSRRHLPFFPIGMAGYGAQRCCRPRARRDDERCQIPHPHGSAYPLPRPRGLWRTGSGRRRTGRGGWARSF